MTRALCLWFPNWPIQRRQQRIPALREQPLVLFGSAHGRDIVSHCSPLASRRGIRSGMPLAEARTLLQDRHGSAEVGRCLPDEPDQDRTALRQLAWECELFSPIVGLEDLRPPESLLLDITGCADHFGGERPLVEQMIHRFREEGLSPRVGLADSVGAAWAAAHFRTKLQASCLVLSQEQESFLRGLPVAALRLSSVTLERLQQVGLRNIGQTLALPRASLPARFGGELLQRIDQALGEVPELIVPERRPEALKEIWKTEEPLWDVRFLEIIAGDLLERLLSVIRPRRQGLKRLVWELEDVERRVTTRALELLHPTVNQAHLLSLLSLQWEQLALTAGIQRISLTADQVELLVMSRQTLWEMETGESSPAIHQLIETLSSRLGSEAVLRPSLRADDQPELAFELEPLVGGDRRSDTLKATTGPSPGLTRPLCLKRTPIAVDVIARHRHGPPTRFHWQQQDWNVRQSWGPERITTAWWRGPLVRRDYFQVECEQGERFWLFRELVTGRWYLHAAWD